MSNEVCIDLLGIGLGPFNLSLAALLDSHKDLKYKFCEMKEEFSWHSELMFDDAVMQTSFLKDLVTPVDPTNQYSFLNYLVQKGQIYQFINTDRKNITRMEFEEYCRWASQKLQHRINFNQKIKDVHYDGDKFIVDSGDSKYFATHLCVATGPKINVPKCVENYLGPNVFHAKSRDFLNCSFEGKRVLLVGGGQTGIEILRNGLKEKWGRAKSIKMITGRENLISLEEGPFVNEIFTPEFVSNFYSLPQTTKDDFTERALYTSDGNTPQYLNDFYRDLYIDRFYSKKYCDYEILPMRWLTDLKCDESGYSTTIQNKLSGLDEYIQADIVILATGFTTELPEFMSNLRNQIEFDEFGRMCITKNYRLKGSFNKNKIFVMNYSRHGHGVADPQTSLMSWRSSVIANDLIGQQQYVQVNPNNSFINFFNNSHENEVIGDETCLS